VTQNGQHCESCPMSELAAFDPSAIFGTSGVEGAARKAGGCEWQL
jgi:hypothetical protein